MHACILTAHIHTCTYITYVSTYIHHIHIHSYILTRIHTYVRTYIVVNEVCICVRVCEIMCSFFFNEERKEGYVLLNHVHNTFYLWLLRRGKPAAESSMTTHCVYPTDRTVLSTVFVTPYVQHWLFLNEET